MEIIFIWRKSWRWDAVKVSQLHHRTFPTFNWWNYKLWWWRRSNGLWHIYYWQCDWLTEYESWVCSYSEYHRPCEQAYKVFTQQHFEFVVYCSSLSHIAIWNSSKSAFQQVRDMCRSLSVLGDTGCVHHCVLVFYNQMW